MEQWSTAGYLRLSREDGDRAESDSITNQRNLLDGYLKGHPELQLVGFYQDDGYTGTNFDRPAFRRLEADIARGKVNCVLVKDLSRFGRDYIEVGRYLEREFPARGVRFIAINDHVDSAHGRYDLLLPMKNIFNAQYARDISDKVRSAIRTKQQRGEFIGAFPSYGYQKDPTNHNHLVVDPAAAQVVRRIFELFEQGYGKIRIARQLNEEGIPSPSEYKRILGERYHNGRRLNQTTYWTYATIHRILRNQIYAGRMEQGRNYRPIMHGKARQLDRGQWTVVPNTHEAIIDAEQWARVQTLLHARTRQVHIQQNQSPFAGFLRCGDCGRAMVKTSSTGRVCYICGSYKRYGPTVCSRHSISLSALEQLVLEDLNQVVSAVQDLQALVQPEPTRDIQAERRRLEAGLARIRRLKQSAYEDFQGGLLSRDDFLHYKADYERQEQELSAQLKPLAPGAGDPPPRHPWVQSLLQHRKLASLDRVTVAETIRQIRVFEDGRLEITYAFSNELGLLKE